MCQRISEGFLVKGSSIPLCSPANLGKEPGTDDCVNVMFLNARSIMNKFDEFLCEVSSNNPDVVGVTESWAHADILDSELNIMGYTLFRHDRSDTFHGRGGGVLLYVRSNLSCVQRIDLEGNFSDCIWCEISGKSNSSSVIFGLVYRSPNTSEENNRSLLNCINAAADKRIVVFGDFNYPDIDWTTSTSGPHGRDFLSVVSDCFLFQHIDFPTRGENCLDIVLSSEEYMVSDVTDMGKIGSSDHTTISFKLNFSTKVTSNNSKVPDYRKADYGGIKSELSVDWVNLLGNLDTNDSWNLVNKMLADAVKKFVPIRKRRSKNKPMWMTTSVMKEVKKKKKLWNTYKKSRQDIDLLNFQEQQKKTKNLIHRAKVEFEYNLAEGIKDNPKSFYSYVRSKQKTKDVVGPLKSEIGDLVTDSKEMADLLNNYFASVFTEESFVDFPVTDGYDSLKVLDFVDFSEEVVANKLKSLCADKTPGPDNIHPAVLLKCFDVLSLPLSLIFKKSFNEGLVPKDWRIANVTPIFKKGDHSSTCNYRPVSLTSVVCRVMESIIKDSIMDHLLENELLNVSQHGFLPKRSCVSNLLQFVDDVTAFMDDKKSVDVIYLDFSKAFDKVPVKRLVLKVKDLGIVDKTANWIESWLSDRCQRVVINGLKSEWENVTSGVPQGSVLGPLLFLIFINDLDNGINSNMLKFADDTKLYRGINSIEDSVMLQEDLDRLIEWSNLWQMSFNVSKCKVMHIGSSEYTYSMNNSNLEVVSEEKDLGVIFTDSFKPSSQCCKAAKTANQILGMVKRNFNFLGKNIVLRLYKMLVRPHLEYSVQAWNPYFEKDKFILEQVQHRATKLIKNIKDLPYEDRLDVLGLTTLELRRVRGDMIQVFKCVNGIDTFGVKSHVNLQGVSRTRGHSMKLKKDFSRLDVRKFSFSERVVDEWNGLPEGVVSADTVLNFKINIDLHFANIGRL